MVGRGYAPEETVARVYRSLGCVVIKTSDYRAALDAGRAGCLYIGRRRPGAKERGR